jgi:hypothetical protein
LVQELLRQFGGRFEPPRTRWQRRLDEALGEPVFLTPQDVDIPEAWQLKLTPAETELGFTETLITPEGEEVAFEDVFLVDGEWRTRAQMEALEIAAAIPEALPIPPEIPPEVVIAPDEELMYREYLRTGGTFDVETWRMIGAPIRPEETDIDTLLDEIRETGRTAETEALLLRMAPEATEEDISRFFEPVGIRVTPETETLFYDVFPQQLNVDAFLDLGRDKPEELLKMIWLEGDTEASRNLIKSLWPQVTDEDIDDIFTQPTREFMPEPERPTLAPLMIDALPKVVTTDSVDEMLDFFSDKPDVLRSNLITIGRNDDTELLVRELYPGITEQGIKDYFNSAARRVEREALRITETGEYGTFTAGVGGLISNFGGIFKWLGVEGIGEHLTRAGQFMQVRALPVEPAAFSWEQLFNPNSYYVQGFIQSLPSLMLLAVPAVGAYGLAGSVAAKVGLGGFKRAILTGVGGAVMSRPLESAMEAGNAYDMARAKDMTHEEAKEVANQVFLNNLKLAGLDATQIAFMFLPAPARLSGSLLVKTVFVAGKLFYTGLTEGGEEIYQDIIMRQALGEEIKWDEEMQLVFAIGTFAGIAMGAGGDLIVRIQNRVVGGFSPEQTAQFDESKADFITEGFEDDVAAQKALDDMAEADATVAQSIEDVSKQVEKEFTIEQIEVEDAVDQAVVDNLRQKLAQEGEIVIEPVEVAPEVTRFLATPDDQIVRPTVEVFDALRALGFSEDFLSKMSVREMKQALRTLTTVPEAVPEVFTVEEYATEKGIGIAEASRQLADRAIRGEVESLGGVRYRELPTAPAVIVHKGTEPEGISIGNEIGVRYEGIQEGIVPTTMMFTDVRQTGSTFTATTLEEARTKLANMREAFAREEAIAEVTFEQGIAELTPEQAQELQEAGLEVTQPFPDERQVVSQDGEIIPPDQPIAKGVSDETLMTKDIGVLERFRPTRQVFRRMGLYVLHRGIQKAEVEHGEARAVFDNKLTEVNKWVKKDRRVLIFRELENPGTIKGLTFNEKRAVIWFRENFDRWADALNLPRSKRLTNYVTHIFEEDIAQELKAKHPLDPAISRAMEYRTPKTIFNPFLQERLGKTGVLEDPFAAASAYESRQLKVFYYEPFLQKIATIANDLDTPPVFRDYLKDYSRRMTGEPSKIDREINNTLQGLADKLDKLPGGDMLANYLRRGNPVGMASYNFTSALYTLWLGFKATSAIRNLSQHTLIIGEVGPVHFANGLRLRLTREGRGALDKSLVLRSRKAAFVPGIDDSFQSRWTDKFRETALWMFRFADKQNVSDAFLAGYSEAKALLPEASEQVWLDRGDEVAADTQYLYTKMNSMAISQSAPGRVFSVLTTWTANWMELMTKWVSRRPSQVYIEYESATGKKVSGANWATSYKAILMYMVIVGLGYAIKEQTRLRAWEYTGITSVRYLADIIGGDFPGLEAPGAVADIIVGFLTNDDRMLSSGWNQLRRTLTPGILRQIDYVASGERDWLTLFFYLEGQDYYLKKLKGQWEKEWKDYPTFPTPEDRAKYDADHPETDTWTDAKIQKTWRQTNPLLEAKMFISNKFSVLSSDEARAEVLRLIDKHGINTEFIKGYEKVFGIDSSEAFDDFQKQIGTEKPREEGEEIEYFTMSSFAAEVNDAVRIQGRDKVIRDGNKLAIEYLEAKDSFVQYEAIEEGDGRKLFRQQFPDIEAQLYLWGQITAFQNPKSADILLELMEKHSIAPEGMRAFLDDPAKYDKLFTPKFELVKKWFDESSEYENYGNPESGIYIEDDDERAKVRQQFKLDNPEWVDDMRRIEAIDLEASDRIIEAWVDRGHIIDDHSAGSSEAKVWLLDNPDIHKWALDNELLTDDGSKWNEPVLRLNAKWRVQDEEYDALPGEGDARENYMLNNEAYRKDRRRRDAYGAEGPAGETFSEVQVEQYVTYYELPVRGFRQERYLLENPDFGAAMHIINGMDLPDPSKIPSVRYDEIYEANKDAFDKFWGLADHTSEHYIENEAAREGQRLQMRYVT